MLEYLKILKTVWKTNTVNILPGQKIDPRRKTFLPHLHPMSGGEVEVHLVLGLFITKVYLSLLSVFVVFLVSSLFV